MKGKHTWLVLCFNRLDQFITQILENLPDMVIIYVGSNDITIIESIILTEKVPQNVLWTSKRSVFYMG